MDRRMCPVSSSTSLFSPKPPSCHAAGQYPDAGVHATAYAALEGLPVHTHPALPLHGRTQHYAHTGGAAMYWRSQSEIRSKKMHS